MGRARARLERALDAVEDLVHDAGPELDRERLARAEYWVADRQPRRVLVNLDRRGVGLELDDLADELGVAAR